MVDPITQYLQGLLASWWSIVDIIIAVVDAFLDAIPDIVLLALKLTWTIFGAILFARGYSLVNRRELIELGRQARAENGLGRIKSRRRIRTARTLRRQGAIILAIGILSLLTPPPVRPSLTLLSLAMSLAFLEIARSTMAQAADMDSGDREEADYLYDHPELRINPEILDN